MNKVETLIEEMLAEESLILAILSDPRTKDGPAKVIVRPILLKNRRAYHFERHADNKAVHANFAPPEAKARLLALLREEFRQAHLYTETADLQVTIRPRGTASIRTRPPSRTTATLQHDRKKGYLLPEGEPCAFLHRLGVMTAEGKVIASRQDKFRQINRFLEMVADAADSLPTEGRLHVVDFGCGKSYLTFALYHYLRHLKGRDVRIVGLDVKKDVVAHCGALAEDLGYDGLTFAVGEIKGYRSEEPVDMVVSLHACDTATDDALAQAVQWGAKVILAVPCCQHELFDQVRNEMMRPLLKHGVLKERLSALITDSLRAALLEIAGYSVQMLEFIAMEHTPKNLLIRAVKNDAADSRHRQRLREEYAAFRDFWHVESTMEKA